MLCITINEAQWCHYLRGHFRDKFVFNLWTRWQKRALYFLWNFRWDVCIGSSRVKWWSQIPQTGRWSRKHMPRGLYTLRYDMFHIVVAVYSASTEIFYFIVKPFKQFLGMHAIKKLCKKTEQFSMLYYTGIILYQKREIHSRQIK